MPNEQDLKKELSQLSDLQHEVQLLDEQLSSLYADRQKINSNVKTDSVKGSMPEFPYVLHNITVKGLSDDELGQKFGIKSDIEAVKAQLHDRRVACVKEYKRLNEFIAGVEDSEMRQILTLKYVYGKSFQQIAFAIGKSDEQIPRKKHDKFLEKYEKYE
jgi:hypothetical protein